MALLFYSKHLVNQSNFSAFKNLSPVAGIIEPKVRIKHNLQHLTRIHQTIMKQKRFGDNYQPMIIRLEQNTIPQSLD
jgi:hypothetical protein